MDSLRIPLSWGSGLDLGPSGLLSPLKAATCKVVAMAVASAAITCILYQGLLAAPLRRPCALHAALLAQIGH